MQVAPLNLDLESLPLEQFRTGSAGIAMPRQTLYFAHWQINRDHRRWLGIRVNHTLRNLSATRLAHQFDATLYAQNRLARMHPTAEARTGVGGNLCDCILRRTLMKFQFAASRSTLVVLSLISVSAPPIIPPMLSTPAVSHTSRSRASSVRFCWSSVSSVSPALGKRVIIVGALPPARAFSLSKSNVLGAVARFQR